MKRCDALELIGDTPLIALTRISPPGSIIWGKAEFMNPGGSIKDRAALHIIDSVYQSGVLRAGQTVVEMTSGNMGAGLAIVCGVRDNPFVATMSRGNSPERVRMLAALGAEVVLVDQVDGSPGRVTGADIEAAAVRARQITQERGGYFVDQFNNRGSVEAHEQSTGPEIFDDLGASLSAFVACVGSGGTFVGVSRYLKSKLPALLCAAVEPAGAEVLAGKPVSAPKHLLQGTGYGRVPDRWDHALPDAYLAVSDEEAIDYRKRLATQEGLYVGFSAAANVCAAAKLINSGRLGKFPVVATILCDTGLKYS